MTDIMDGWIAADDAKKREEILKSLGSHLRKTRLSSLTMQDIANQLNISKGTLYNYFRNKQDIIFHCHMKVMDNSMSALVEAQKMPGKVSARLSALLNKHILGMMDDVYGGVLFLGIDTLTPQQRQQYFKRRDKFEHGLRDLIQRGVDDGEFRSVNPRIASLAILGSVNWLPRWYNPEGALPADKLASEMTEFFVSSLVAPSP